MFGMRSDRDIRREQIRRMIREGQPLVANGSNLVPVGENAQAGGVPIKPHDWGWL